EKLRTKTIAWLEPQTARPRAGAGAGSRRSVQKLRPARHRNLRPDIDAHRASRTRHPPLREWVRDPLAEGSKVASAARQISERGKRQSDGAIPPADLSRASSPGLHAARLQTLS